MPKRDFTVESFESEELAAALCNCKEDEDTDVIEQALYDKYEISLEKFHELVQDFFDKLTFGISPLTETALVGLSVEEEKRGRWLIKKEVNGAFIAGVIQWLSGNKLKPDEGFVRTITSKGNPEYEITLKKMMSMDEYNSATDIEEE